MTDDPTTPSGAPQIRFDYIKSNFHRVVHADGVVGGPTGSGLLTVSFFNERAPIPQQVAHEVTVDPETKVMTLGNEVQSERVVRQAVVREVEVSVVLGLTTARSLKQWLENHIDTLEQIHRMREKGGEGLE